MIYLATGRTPSHTNQKRSFHFGWRIVAAATARTDAAMVTPVFRQAVAVDVLMMMVMMGAHFAF